MLKQIYMLIIIAIKLIAVPTTIIITSIIFEMHQFIILNVCFLLLNQQQF